MATANQTPMRVRRRRRSAGSSAPAIVDRYRRTRAVILLCLLLMLFCCLWLINGDWTAGLLVRSIGVSLAAGWAAHLVVSSLELAGPILRPYLDGLPPWVGGLIIVISLPFGVLDVLSSAIGVSPYLTWSGMSGVEFNTLCTVAGLFVAFAPERMIYFLSIALVAVLGRSHE